MGHVLDGTLKPGIQDLIRKRLGATNAQVHLLRATNRPSELLLVWEGSTATVDAVREAVEQIPGIESIEPGDGPLMAMARIRLTAETPQWKDQNDDN